MHKKIPKICTGSRVKKNKIYLYHSTKIAIAKPHSVEWQTDSSVQKQWFMDYTNKVLFESILFIQNIEISMCPKHISKRKYQKYKTS